MITRKPAEIFPPGEYIKDELEARGWTQSDLAGILGRQVMSVSDLVKGKCGITVDTAIGLASAFGTSPELWMNLDQAFKLHKLASRNDVSIARRAEIYKVAPVSDMIKRGWIEPTENVDVLEHQIMAFYDTKSVSETPSDYCYHARKSTSYTSELTSIQRAWLHRCARLSKGVEAARFNAANISSAIEKLKLLLHEPVETRHVSSCLSEFGVKLVVTQAFHGSKIDGACLWVDGWPVIGLSLRFDRIDNFWFTLFHEIHHCNNQEMSLDVDLGQVPPGQSKPLTEIAADEFAIVNLVDQKKLENFIVSKGPLYSTRDIEAFASSIHVHPGLVVGQLQARKEVNYTTFRKLLVPIRKYVIDSTITDGFNLVAPSEYTRSRH